jgi:hypothetical protein
VNVVRDKITKGSDNDAIDFRQSALVIHEHLHSLGHLGDPAIGDLKRKLVEVSDLSPRDSLLNVPVA